MNKKLVSVLMVVVMLVAVLATPVRASGTTTPEKFAKATNITGLLTLSWKIFRGFFIWPLFCI